MSYQSDTQKLRATKVKEHSSIVDEKLLSERVYYGDQTHVYVGYLRAFKSGYFEGTLKSASNLNGNLNCSKELEHYAS